MAFGSNVGGWSRVHKEHVRRKSGMFERKKGAGIHFLIAPTEEKAHGRGRLLNYYP